MSLWSVGYGMRNVNRERERDSAIEQTNPKIHLIKKIVYECDA